MVFLWGWPNQLFSNKKQMDKADINQKSPSIITSVLVCYSKSSSCWYFSDVKRCAEDSKCVSSNEGTFPQSAYRGLLHLGKETNIMISKACSPAVTCDCFRKWFRFCHKVLQLDRPLRLHSKCGVLKESNSQLRVWVVWRVWILEFG